MKPRFELDKRDGANDKLSPNLIDPEAYDASEQTFAASLEQTPSSKMPRFLVEAETDAAEPTHEFRAEEPRQFEEASAGETREPEAGENRESSARQAADPESWRREVAARVSHYRARRRPREPRYPSLQLKFETEPVWREPVVEGRAGQLQTWDESLSTSRELIRIDQPSVPAANETPSRPRVLFPATNESTAKVIEFASYSAPLRPFDELAEPVYDRPRIIEAPELVPPPPALGGISIEAVEEPAYERRPGFEIPLQAAPMGRRMAAAGIDAALVLTAIVSFAYIFFRIAAAVPPPGKVAGTAALLIGGLWSAYQYLLLVYSGTTPGLKLARLELQKFDGDMVPRNTRRWRVLASVLSGVSLGLGYAWCLLDEDELCWHDRVTRTYMAPKK